MVDETVPPPAPDDAPPPIVGQMQAQAEQEYQQAVARGGALGEHRAEMESLSPSAPTAAEAAAPPGDIPPATSMAPPPPPPTAKQAAAPPGDTPSKPVTPPKPVPPPSPEKDPMGFVPWLVHGSIRELGAGAAQTASEAGQTINMAAGAVASVVDKLWDIGTGDIRPSGETYHTGAQDAVFNFMRDHVQPAIDHWQPAPDAGPVAKGLHQASSMLAAAPYGAAGVTQFVTNTFSNSATNAIDQGKDAKTAVTQGTVDAVATGLLMKVLGKDLAGRFADQIPTEWIRRAVSSIPAGDLINIGQDLTKKFLLEQSGNDKQAKSVTQTITDHLTNLDELVTNAIFGAVSPHAEKITEEKPLPGAPPPPKPAEAAPPKPEDMPPPPGPPPAQAAAAPKSQTPAQDALEAFQKKNEGVGILVGSSASTEFNHLIRRAQEEKVRLGAPEDHLPGERWPPPVPDQPSVEAAKDVRAQLTDMRRSDTPRRGVLVTPDTQAHVDSLPDGHEHADPIKNQLEQARAQGRSVQTPVGELIVKTKGDAAKATAQLKAGADPQLVIGRLTGAGEGKDPSQTVVVQGREMDGSITTEKAVRPEDQGAATQAVIDEGKVPVVTTPEGVIAERHVSVHDEKQAALPEKAPAETNKAPGPETAPPEIAAPEAPQEAAPPQEGFYKTESGKEVPVHIAGTPSAEGKLQVHPLNEEGEPQAPVEVPADRVRTGAAAEPAAAEEPTNAQAKGTALDQLPAALAAHEKQEQAPTGRKNPASLQERQDNASAFAQVLGAAAKEAAEKGRAAEPSVRRAAEAAAKARGLTNKSKEATDKGQGTSHAIVATRTREMHRAARELLGKTKPGEEPTEVIEKKPVKPVEPVKPRERTATKVVTEKAAAAGAKDTARFHSLTERYLKAKEPEDARAAREELEQHVRSVVEKLGQPPEQADAILHHLTELRAESGRREAPKMSDTLEEEEHEFDRPQEGFQTIYRPSAEAPKEEAIKWHEETKRIWRSMEETGHKMSKAGVIRRLKLLLDTGMPMSYHELLQHVRSYAGHDPDLQARVTHLLSTVPDVPTFFRSEVLNPYTFKKLNAAGLFHAAGRHEGGANIFDPTMQIKLREGTKAFTFIAAVLHEGQHAATEYAVNLGRKQGNPIVKELDAARDLLEKRLRSKYGDAAIDSIHNFFGENLSADAKTELPPELRHLYGITSTSEMIAELDNNPHFMEEVIRSEDFASPTEKLPPIGGIPGLLHKIITAAAKLMGYDPKLALHIADARVRLEDLQRNSRSTRPLYEPDAFARLTEAQPTARLQAFARPGAEGPPMDIAASRAMAEADDEKDSLLEEPKPVKAEGALRAIASPEAVQAARDNIHAIASRSVDMGRNAVTALKTVGKIFRDNRGYFGHEDDPNNPLNELQEADHERNRQLHAMRTVSNPTAKLWMRASTKDNLDAGALLRDATLWKIDPRESLPQAGEKGFDAKTFARAQEYKQRYDRMSDTGRAIFDGVLKANKTLRGMERRAAVDAALEGFGVDVSDGQKQLLYGARDPNAFDRLLKEGGLVDVGDKNEKMRAALRDWVGAEMSGPYAHLGRPGDYVMQATPEGTKEFGSQAEAESFARQARDTSPGSKADAEERGGKWVVDYKIQHVSMHATRAEAEKAREAMSKQGFDTQPVTHKMMTRELATNLSGGMRELVTQAMRKNESAGESLLQAYLHMQAQRSAYAGSQLMRKGFGGVKAKDMRQNFAEHAASSIWHAAQVRTLFQQAAAMARLRDMVKTTDDQALAYKRSETVQALNKHAAMANQVNTGGSFNRKAAQLGFLSYLTSPAHAAIWMTQNFSTGIPVAGARYGYGKATAAFMRGMGAVGMPSLKRAMREQFSKWASPDDIHAAVVEHIANHPTMGKWAPQIRELYARGVISHGYANDLGALAQGSTPVGVRAMDWARVAPAMADAFNRTSTALAGLELTGGDLRKTADLVQEIHADYSAQNKPLAFKALSRVPGGTSLTMFKTYAQAMAELVYGNLHAATVGADFKSAEGRAKAWEGAKTVAGLMVGNAMFAGVYGAVGLEPIRLLVYAYHKLFDEEGEVWDMKNAIHHFLVDNLGAAAGNAAARGPIADVLGVDVQDRMGLANLFFHNPPDLLTSDKDTWKTWVNDEAGPLVQMVANGATGAAGHLQNGEYLQAMLSVLPVKVVQDSLKALQLLQTGKQTGTGAAITQPSALDAAKQAFGLKPASVADAQEARGVKSEYSKVQGMVRSSIIRQILAAPEGSPELDDALARRQKFNDNNPGAGISVREIKEAQMRNAKTEAGVPSRNQRAEEAADFSGSR